MKLKWLVCVFLVLVAVAIRLPAQQSEADRKIFEDIKAKAENGEAEAQYILGIWYFNGKDVAKNVEEALKWFRKAANQGNAQAQCYLAGLYLRGQGVETNKVEAFKLYRKAADQGSSWGQGILGAMYAAGEGCSQDDMEAVKWSRKAADQGNAESQYNLGVYYRDGRGVKQDFKEAANWFGKAAEQNDAMAQSNLGVFYQKGEGVAKDEVEAVKWYRKAAEQNNAPAQYNLSAMYYNGNGVPRNYIEAYKWESLAASQGFELAKKNLSNDEMRMTVAQVAEAQRLAAAFVPRIERQGSSFANTTSPANPSFTGTGFFITDDGYLISNAHVVEGATQVRLVTSAGLISAKVVKVDSANDLALLKAEGKFSPLPVISSRNAKLGGTVATVGFPNIGLQGFAPKLAKGEIASLSGAQDDTRYFQISVPLQPGNSGGALVDERGNVVGIVSAKLNASAALAASGALPENVNYAVKSSFLLSFLESVPEVSAKLKEPNTGERKFEDVVKSAKQAAVLVLVY